MLIFVAYNGKSLELSVDSTTRISAIMETLVGVTDIPYADQILMSDTFRLDASKPLSAYNLPASGGHKINDVFLYNKSHLRIQTEMPVPEIAKPLSTPELQQETDPEADEALERMSPLLRILPQYKCHFARHVKIAQAGLAATRQRHKDCSDLVSEMEVQSSAIDTARGSVESHYTYITTQLSVFVERYSMQRKTHSAMLAGFDSELEALAEVDLLPAACSLGQTKLLHLVDASKLRAWASECHTCHTNLAKKVRELEDMFGSLRSDVEAVFMQAPSVQLEALATQLEAMGPHLDELASILQVLENDNVHIQKLMRSDMSADGAVRSATTLDNCQLMETVHENHANHLIPQVEQYKAMYESLYQRCLEDKNQMTRDVIRQLQQISSQQMKIQSMRNKLAVFKEAAVKEDDMFSQLLLVRRIPAAYNHCLAECMRRKAFGEVYAEQARQMAERMAKLRSKERDKREAFRKQVQGFIPGTLLAGLGLHHQPPHCQISLPSQQGIMPNISLSDLRRLPTGQPEASAAGATSALPLQRQPTIPPDPPGNSRILEEAAEGGSVQGLKMQNAVLRAEIAELYVRDCMVQIQSSVSNANLPATGAAQGSTERQVLSASLTKRLQAAVAAKQDLVIGLEGRLAQAKQLTGAYEIRIAALEKQLTEKAACLNSMAVADYGQVCLHKESADLGLAESQSEPLPLTPVLISPTRSASPATIAALPQNKEALHSAISASVSAAHKQRLTESGQGTSPGLDAQPLDADIGSER